MTDSGPVLSRLGLAQYIDAFVAEGFETWETVLDITESDLDALGVKLGHRRRLQRGIANARASSLEGELRSPILSLAHQGADDGPQRKTIEAKTPSGTTGKRKYRRHPKADENAPERPPSAYVIFSNKIREELRPQTLSFTEIAKRVGESWQILSPEHKEPYESQASAAKEKYHAQLGEYKKTEQHREYTEYLVEFKFKNAPNADKKRPKIEKECSVASSESAESQHDHVSSFSTNAVAGRHRVGSAGSTGTGSTPAPSEHLSPDDPTSLSPIPIRGGPSTGFRAPTPGSLSPASSSAGRKEHFHASPGFRPSGERPEDIAQGQRFPRIMPLETQGSRALPGISSASTDPVLSRGGHSPLGSSRRAKRLAHVSLQTQDSGLSISSSRSSNLSGEGSRSSSIYSSIEDTKSHRTLPSLSTVGLKSIASLPYTEPGGQSRYTPRSDQATPTHGHALHSPFGSSLSGTFESLQLPLPHNISFQRDQLPPRDPPANLECVAEDIPHERKSLKDLALGSMSSSPSQDLQSHQQDFVDIPRFQHLPALQDGPLVSANRLPTAFLTPGEGQNHGHDDHRTAAFSVSNSDPLSVLAYAGRMVDQDARLRSPKQ